MNKKYDVSITFADPLKESINLKCKVIAIGIGIEEYESQDVYRTVEISWLYPQNSETDEISLKLCNFLGSFYEPNEEDFLASNYKFKKYSIDGTLIIKNSESEWHLQSLKIISINFEELDHSDTDYLEISVKFEYLSAKKG